MKPLTSVRNLTPSSIGRASANDGVPGVAVTGKALHGQPDVLALVVNDHNTVEASALPARSLTRGSVLPPRTVAVKTPEAAKALLGVRIAVRVAAS